MRCGRVAERLGVAGTLCREPGLAVERVQAVGEGGRAEDAHARGGSNSKRR